MKTQVYKWNACFLSYFTLLISCQTGQICIMLLKYPNEERSHNFSHVAPLSWSPVVRPCPSFPLEKSEAFVIKDHRHMAPLVPKANDKDTVDPRFYEQTSKCHRTQKGQVRLPTPPTDPHCVYGNPAHCQCWEPEAYTEGREALS